LLSLALAGIAIVQTGICPSFVMDWITSDANGTSALLTEFKSGLDMLSVCQVIKERVFLR
jgi:hypothetical protein